MTITGVTGSNSAGSSLANSRATMADNFDTFLQILTTQLRNQNPLDPLDTNQFTQQLVQFTSVEQQLKTNEYMEALLQANQNSNATDAVSFIGKTVTSNGRTSDLVNGKASWAVSLTEAAETASVTIRDANGNIVFTQDGSMPQGEGHYEWDGTLTDGGKASAGAYSISIEARNSAGAAVTVKTELTGLVSGVDLSASSPVLIIAGQRVAIDTVTSVRSQ